MIISGSLASLVDRLTTERIEFVVATVVRVNHPTSVRPGDNAVVLGDGTIEGFVGGACAESSVRLHALRVLETGEPLLLRLVPGAAEGSGCADHDRDEGAVVERNPCLSGGSLEIFLEPRVPPARVTVVGTAPVARAVCSLAEAAGFDVECLVPSVASVALALPRAGDAAVIVASHGAGEECAVLRDALLAGVPYVALVASSVRGEAVRAALDVPDELRALLHTPAGLDIGARTPEEIAISILAELVAVTHAHPEGARVRGVTAAASRVTAIDPVCGMVVAVAEDSVWLPGPDGPVYFCGAHCRDAYAGQHALH